MRGVWYSTDGGSGKGVLLVAGAVVAVASGAGAEIAATVVAVLIVLAVVVGLIVAGGVAYLVHRSRNPSYQGIIPEPVRYELPAPERPAIEPPAPRELHQHVHNDVHLYVGPGADPKAVAEIIRRSQRPE